jgi:hypothetical protein
MNTRKIEDTAFTLFLRHVHLKLTINAFFCLNSCNKFGLFAFRVNQNTYRNQDHV